MKLLQIFLFLFILFHVDDTHRDLTKRVKNSKKSEERKIETCKGADRNTPTSYGNSNSPDITKIDVNSTSLFRDFRLHSYGFGHAFSLLESQYHHDNYSLKTRFDLEKFIDSEYKDGLYHLSNKWWRSDTDISSLHTDDTHHNPPKRPKNSEESEERKLQIYNSNDTDTSYDNSNYPDISKVDMKFTSLYRYFKLHTYTFGHSFSLLESQYHHENYSLEAGFYLEKFINSEYKYGLNHLSMKWWKSDFEFQIGKYVTKIGVLDYLPTLDILNPTRVSFYNDKNKNIKKYPKWMAQGDLYIQDNIKLTFFVKEYEDRMSDYYYIGKLAVLDNFIPYFLANLPNKYSNYVGNRVLLPLYDVVFKPILNQSLSYTSEYAYEMLSSDLKNGTFGINALFDFDDMSVGVVWFNTYAQIPLLTPTEELKDILLNTDQQELGDSMINSLKDTPLSQLIKPVRYDKFGIYTEGYIGQLGYRSEFSFQNNYPVFDRLSDIYTFAFGVDHKLWRVYNSLEVKCSHMPRFNHNLYQGVLASKLDPIDFYVFDLKLENAVYFIKYGNYNYHFVYPAITLSYNNFDISLEYYYSSDKAYMEDSFIVKLRMVF